MFQPNLNFGNAIVRRVFGISRSEIEQHSTARALAWLNELMADPSIAWANRNTLVLMVGGYDSDPRELYEIPEVRRFLRTIHSKWKYWFFFACDEYYTLAVLCNCILGAKKVNGRMSQLPTEKVEQFLTDCTQAMNSIFDKWHFPEEENKKLYFGALKQLGWDHGHKH